MLEAHVEGSRQTVKGHRGTGEDLAAMFAANGIGGVEVVTADGHD